MTALRPSRSRLLVGSSSRRKSGSAKMRAASPARVLCPPDSVARSVSGGVSSPTRPRADMIRISSVQSASASSSTVASANFGTTEQGERIADAEEVDNPFVRPHLHSLPQDSQAPPPRPPSPPGDTVSRKSA